MKKNNYFSRLTLLCLSLSMLLSSCELIDIVFIQKADTVNPHKLNVIYFLPSDMEPHLEYERRLSGALRHMQGYFGRQLEQNGYGYKTFGVQEHPEIPGYVNIKVIHAAGDHKDYPYSGGGNKAVNEIKAYFEAHPEEKTSDHFLVFIPVHEDGTGVPFYGLGKFAFTRDYAGGYDMEKWVDGEGFPTVEDKWIGGTIHELGHGLNLPHNRQRVSDDFIAMMGNGNSSYWNQPNNIKLTKASAMILRYNQLFSSDPTIQFYEESPVVEFMNQRVYADSEYLYVQSKFTSTVPVRGAIVYNDPKTNENDADYNAITWANGVIPTFDGDSISFKMPLSDIDEHFKEHPFSLRLSLVHENGRIVTTSYPYSFVNGQPNIDVNEKTYLDYDRSNWTIAGFSSQEEYAAEGALPGLAEYLLDGDYDSFWHSGWKTSPPKHPHWVAIDMASQKTIHGISVVQNQKSTNGMLKDFTLYVSDDNENWSTVGDFTASNSMTRQQIVLDTPVEGRYFKIQTYNSYGGTNANRISELAAF
ncbi:discoidin domain-containing protein [Algoriphagus vanfongensis]|uniref:discoidin domain-containing protein n=1 Tax=Algoriphagus vanfongensis TaxID=426371 RepID=UPI000A02632C|nr:discoidin domain-containing protein [Algoriphagus vanfongensis]